MVSISPEQNVEVRHFMNDEHQLTIGVRGDVWPLLQELANHGAMSNNRLSGRGSDWTNLNIWIIGRLHVKPRGIEPWEWVARAAQVG